MSLQDYAKLLRARWLTVLVTTIFGVLAAVSITLFTTPLYKASTGLFVSTTSSGSVAEIYQGNLFSQQRVLSYTQLIMGENLAQRTIDKLNLDMTPDTLREHVKASARSDTVLIDVEVLDESPVRARDIANALSDEFVVMIRDLETPTGGGLPDSRVVVEQRASVPDEPVTPRTALNIVLGLTVGLILGIGLAILRGLLDNTVKSRETIEEITGTSLVGSIPYDKERRKEAPITFDSDNSPIAEEFRKLRTNLQFLAVDSPPRVIVVTSSMPDEGKTTTAINIALALAESEHNVVLVGGDMRRPKLEDYLGLIEEVGFSTVLAGRASLDDTLQRTRFPRLTVLASGAIPPNPSELLGSLAAKKVLKDLRAKFDYVVIDSSPLLAVTDGAILAACADGVLVMARFGATKREHLAQAVGSLEDVGARLLGAVFTMTPVRGGGSYSYYGTYGEKQAPRAVPPVDSTAATPARHRPDIIAGPAANGCERVEPLSP